MQTTFAVGDTVHLKSSPATSMTVGRVPSEENNDLLKPLMVECVWLDKNDRVHFSKFPLAMITKSETPQPIGFKRNSNGSI